MSLIALFSGACLLALAPQFEVASVRASQPGQTNAVNIGLRIDGSQVRITSLGLDDYVAMAFRVKKYQVTGPEWITSTRFDVSAKLPEGSKTDQIPEMMQALLAERFQLKFHREQKEFPVYALIVSKPPLKLKASAPDASDAAPKGALAISASGSANGVSVNLGNGSYYTFANGKFEIHKTTMNLLAQQLERYVDRPIVDRTGDTGVYDLSVTVNDEDARTMMIRAAVNSGVVLPPQALQLLDTGSIASLQDALQQFGLKLDQRREKLDVLVVDSASKTPTDN